MEKRAERNVCSVKNQTYPFIFLKEVVKLESLYLCIRSLSCKSFSFSLCVTQIQRNHISSLKKILEYFQGSKSGQISGRPIKRF